MKEVWKDVKGYEGLYQISNLGRFKSFAQGKEKILTPSVNQKGYLFKVLYKDGVTKQLKVHRMVAEAFIPNPHGYAQVNHKDEDKTNNTASNLEWCDQTYNINYGTRTEKSTQKRSKAVVQIDEAGNAVMLWASAPAVQRALGITAVWNCCTGHNKAAGGYRWKYLSDWVES